MGGGQTLHLNGARIRRGMTVLGETTRAAPVVGQNVILVDGDGAAPASGSVRWVGRRLPELIEIVTKRCTPAAMAGGFPMVGGSSPRRDRGRYGRRAARVMNTEALRRQFRPNRVTLLFVGESPPTSGKFFYHKGPMTRFTADAFEAAQRSKFSPTDPKELLTHFKQCGCFLDDICHSPINDLPSEDRRRRLAESVAGFARRLSKLKPEAIVVALKKIEPHVRIAAAQAGLEVPIYVVPLPAHGHQTEYVKRLAKILPKHIPSRP